MTAPLIDPHTLQVALKTAALELQAHFAREEGELYRTEDLQQALTQWLELSIESLLEDALFHTVAGDRAYAFNRRAFELQLQKLQPTTSLRSAQPELQVA